LPISIVGAISKSEAPEACYGDRPMGL